MLMHEKRDWLVLFSASFFLSKFAFCQT